MEACPTESRDMLRRLLASTEDQRLASPAGRKDWELWCKFARSVNQDPYLADKQGASHYLERKHLFLAFATALREGSLNGGKPASGSAIERTLRYCGQVLADRGFADPRRRDVGQNQLDREFSRLFRQYKDGDEPVVRLGSHGLRSGEGCGHERYGGDGPDCIAHVVSSGNERPRRPSLEELHARIELGTGL